MQSQYEQITNELNTVHSIDLPTNFITTEHFHKICRTCLTEGEIKSIFEETCYEKSAWEFLKLYAHLEIHQEDPLPQNICQTCLADLCRVHLFVEKCQRSDAVLRYVADSDTKNKINEDCKRVQLSDDATIEISLSNDDCIDANKIKFVDDSDDKDYLIGKRKLRGSRKCRKVIQKSQSSKIQGPPFKCKDCKESYNTHENLKTHRKEVKHPEVRNHACSICSKLFTSSKLRQHMRVHTKEKPYQCKVCFQSFSMSGNLKRHMMTHTGERPHVCEVCGKGFIQATTLQCHRKTHANNTDSANNKYVRINGDDNSPNFSCDYCGRGFKRLARYNAHLKRHFTENGEIKKQHIQDTEPREHICMTCKRAYKTKHLLKAHQLTHGEKTFLCSDCGKGFVTKAALQSHLKVHTGEKPHTCTVCKKSFAHVGSFEAHMLIHTGQKPYNCNVCTKAFTQLSHLKYHLRTHSGERPYVCSFCGKRFALKGNLTVHVRTHTGETPYICPVCGRGFYDSSSMKKHKRGHGDITVSPLQVASTNLNIISVDSVDIINSSNCVDLNALIT